MPALEFPTSPTLDREYAPPGVGKTWKWDGRAWALKKNLTGLIERDYVVAELSAAASAAANTTVFNAAATEAASRGKFLLLRGPRDGTRVVFPMNNVVIPTGVNIVTDGRVELRQGTSSGSFLTARFPIKIEGDLLLNGQNTLQTIAGGYVARHVGLQIGYAYEDGHASYGSTTHAGAVVRGLSAHNFGDTGIECNFCDDTTVDSVSTQRTGLFGVVFWSPLRCRIINSRLANVFPGQPPGVGAPAYDRNAYGISFSNWGGYRRPSYCVADNVVVDRVPSWCAYDCHNGTDITFQNCVALGASQGFAFENHLSGSMARLVVNNCRVICNSNGSETVDGQAFPVASGIFINASSPATSNIDVSITNNMVVNAGEQRPGLQGSAAIGVSFARAVNISNNIIRDAKQTGILLSASEVAKQVLYASVMGNTIDSVVAHAGLRQGIAAGSHVEGRARANIAYAAGATTADYFYQAPPTYLFDYGTVTNGSTAGGDNFRYLP